MDYKKALENLSKKIDKRSFRRYNLSEIISESYRALYDSEEGTNLKKLAESHLEDVRRNPSEIERLSHQLCVIKHVSKMLESKEIEDAELLVPEEKYDTVEPKEKVEESVHDEDVSEEDDEDLLEDTDLTDEEVAELTKHLSEIRKSKKVAEGCESKKVNEASKGRKLRKKIKESKDGRDYIRDAVADAKSAGHPYESWEEFSKFMREDGYTPDEEDKNYYLSICNESKTWKDVSLVEFSKKSVGKAFVKTFKKLDSKLHEGTALTRQESIALYKAANSAMTHLSVELEHNPEFLTTFRESASLLAADVYKLLESTKNGKAPSKATMKSLAKFSEALLREGKVYYPNGMECREDSVDMDKALDYQYGTDRDTDNSKYTTEEKQRAVNYWIKKTDKMHEDEEEDLPPIEDEEDAFVDEEEPEVSEESEEFDQEYADARVELHKEIAKEHADSENPEIQAKLAQDAEEIINLPGVSEEQIAEIAEEIPTEETPDEEGVPTEETPDEEEANESADPEKDEEEIDTSIVRREKCENCNTTLTDAGECPRCDHGEEELELDDNADITDDELAELKKHLTEMRKARRMKK